MFSPFPETLGILAVVSKTARTQQLFEDIVRLRRAERDAPRNRDIVAVRSRLEGELGGTVTRAMAARLLGVSHTAVNKWVRSGDLPVVITDRGRPEVPIGALLDIHEAVIEERTSGRRRLHALEPLMDRQRTRASSLDPLALVGEESGDSGPVGHRRAERRSLAYHRALAKRLRRPMADDALHLLWEWRDAGKVDERYADEWERILQMPVRDIRKAISEDTQRAADLRQNSPLAGLLSEPERNRILREIR